MYTQCPECQIAFRVTAKVLQQAAGNVRCGSCGHAFSALAYLSEEMPDQPAVPDSGIEDDAPADELAETSKRLLETLDELAGPDDVRIEDTGVEWRVLDAAVAEDVRLSPDEIPAADEIRYDDNTPLPDDFGEEQSGPAPLPQRREEDVRPSTEEFEERQSDLALSEPEDWTDILEEVRDPNAESLEVEEELAAIHNELSAIDDALTDEVVQLGDEDIDSADDDDDELEADLVERIEAVAAADLAREADGEHELTDGDFEETGSFERTEFDEDEAEEADAAADEPADGALSLDAGQSEERDEATGELPEDLADDDESSFELIDEDEATENAEDQIDFEPDDIEEAAIAATSSDGIPEPSAEQESGDEEIDEEPESAAAGDIGFAATLVGLENPEELFDENSGEVETIIMEGEFIRNEIEQQRFAAENAARNQLDESSKLLDTYALQRGKVRGGRRSYDPPSSAIIAAIVGLGILLIGQLVHNFRQPLATFGFFNATVAPIYRIMGSPITPDWNILGWQFEATNGSVEDEENTLVIATRIANRSDQSLPYPLVHVSLTNRFEDVIGSRILEPGEYLADNGDPSALVEPGENFDALITVEEASADATGFKLYVCYRIEPGSVRCANEDFKD